MNDPVARKPTTSEVYCRRIKRALPIVEHLACSYCFGKERDVKSADYARFCDFEEGKDPVVFGFPET
jgi:hypothetical protein